MSRIRSTHPEQWTDEDFVELSFAARLLTLAIRNECDDKGIFEWKPKRIKMRLFPCDNVDVKILLSELVEFNQCIQFEVDGKHYGAVRNFRKYQRPKKPNDIHPITDEMAEYVGLLKTISPKKPRKQQPIPQKGEKSPQMEDVGDKMKEIKKELMYGSDEPNSATPKNKVGYQKEFETFWQQYPTTPTMSKKQAFGEWKKLDPESRLRATRSLTKFTRYCDGADHTGIGAFLYALASIRIYPCHRTHCG